MESVIMSLHHINLNIIIVCTPGRQQWAIQSFSIDLLHGVDKHIA